MSVTCCDLWWGRELTARTKIGNVSNAGPQRQQAPSEPRYSSDVRDAEVRAGSVGGSVGVQPVGAMV